MDKTDEMLIVVEEDFLFYNANTTINPVLMFGRWHPRARQGVQNSRFSSTRNMAGARPTTSFTAFNM